MIWLSAKKTWELLEVTEKTFYSYLNNGMFETRYISGKGKGGRQLQVLLSSLPTAAQDKFYNVNQDKINLQHMLENYTGKEREKADFKLRAVTEYKHSHLPISEFLQEFNENYDSDVTRSQLLRWQRKFKEGGFERLIDTRGKNSHHSTISDEAWEFFKDLYLNQNQRSVQICYDYTKKRFNDIPSVHAFRRRVKTIPRNVLIYCRDGEKAFNDKCIPDMSRDVTTISSNEIWCSDHHRIDVFTKDATGKKITRMWLTIFQDVRSMKIVGAICRDAEPNATVIKMCLKQAIEKYGIPERVYFDNGKDYRSKYFSKDFPLSLVNQLGIKSMYAQKYHGQSKICERTFRTFEDRFGKMFNTYTGRDAKKRPERMLHSGQIQTMMPKLHSTNFEGMELIRPMYLIRETDICKWRDYNELHFLQCACHFTETCTTCHEDGTTSSKRLETKKLIAMLKETNPYVENNIFKSVENINLNTIIAYKKDGERHYFLDEY